MYSLETTVTENKPKVSVKMIREGKKISSNFNKYVSRKKLVSKEVKMLFDVSKISSESKFYPVSIMIVSTVL